MKKILPILVILIFLTAIYLYFFVELPDQMVSHWNELGEADGYMNKFWGVFLMPIVSLFIYLMFTFVPRIDPLKKNVEVFRKHFDRFILAIMVFFIYIYALTIIWNLGIIYNMTAAIVPALILLLWFAGDLTKKAKRNWFIGIKTPWTLSSDEVWDKTNKLGGTLIQATAAIMCLGIIFPGYFVWLLMVPLLSSVAITLVYSYVIFKKISSK
jgi:uncharacterized membrane protein